MSDLETDEGKNGVGAFAGFVAAKFYMDSASDTPVGTFYEGNVPLLFAVCVGGGVGGRDRLAANFGGGGNVPPSDLLR